MKGKCKKYSTGTINVIFKAILLQKRHRGNVIVCLKGRQYKEGYVSGSDFYTALGQAPFPSCIFVQCLAEWDPALHMQWQLVDNYKNNN